MRAREFVQEIISMPSVKKRMDIPQFYNSVLDRVRYNQAREKPPMRNFPYTNKVIYEYDRSYKFFIFNEKKIPVFYAGMSKMYDGYKTGVVAGDESVRGQGLGYKLYLAASDYLLTPLYSDSTQTSDSRYGIWAKLIQMVPNRVVAYDQNTKKDIPLDTGVLDRIYHTVSPEELDDISDQSRKDTLLLKLLTGK